MFESLVFLLVWPSFSEEKAVAQQVFETEPETPPTYCGMYCVCRAARSLGLQVEFADLLKPQYIGSMEGSSERGIIQACEDLGLEAQALRRMTCALLRSVDCPVILHVRDRPGAKKYNHWILYMGSTEGKARIYDETRDLALMDFSDLAARWDGSGVLVAKRGVSLGRLRFIVFSEFVLYAGLGAFSLAFIYWVHRNWLATTWRVVSELSAVCAVCMAWALGYDLMHAEGFLSHPPSVKAIQDEHIGSFLPRVTAQKVEALRSQGKVLLLDARLFEDYRAGHIPNAISLPVDLTSEQSRKVLEDVALDRPIVVYCHSSGCPYSEMVARKLFDVGYADIRLFRDGWIGWKAFEAARKQE
jgi:rhodanese-related sulfurtransferase